MTAIFVVWSNTIFRQRALQQLPSQTAELLSKKQNEYGPAFFFSMSRFLARTDLSFAALFAKCPGWLHSGCFPNSQKQRGDRILGLNLGDDYISKPFSPRELVERVRAVLRRFDAPPPITPVRVVEIEIDPAAMTLRVRGEHCPTTAAEFRMLEHFVRHKGRVLSRDQLLDSVWRDGEYVTSRSVDVYVRRVREKIERDPENQRHLKTVRGAGHRFDLT
jgi:hypothetical protein